MCHKKNSKQHNCKTFANGPFPREYDHETYESCETSSAYTSKPIHRLHSLLYTTHIITTILISVPAGFVKLINVH